MLVPLNQNDLLFAVNRLPNKVRETMKMAMGYMPVVAGGYIRAVIANEKVNDVDMFVVGPKDKAAGHCEELALSLARIFQVGIPYPPRKTDNTWSLKIGEMPVQVIHRWTFEHVNQVIESLDFTICQAGIVYDRQCEKWVGYCTPDLYQDLAAKRLVYTSPVRDEDAGGSMLRVLKYYQRGYRIPLDSLGRVMARMLGGIKEENWNKREFMDVKKKGEWEKQIGLLMTGLLREVDPLIDSEHISHLPAQVTE